MRLIGERSSSASSSNKMPMKTPSTILLISFALVTLITIDCGGGGGSHSGSGAKSTALAPSPLQINVDTLAPVTTGQGEPIVGALVQIKTLDNTILATTETGESSLDVQSSPSQAVSLSGRVNTRFSAVVENDELCLVSVEGGDILVSTEDGFSRLPNDTLPLLILPCLALDSTRWMNLGIEPGVIELNALSTSVVETVDLFVELGAIAPGLGATLDEAASGVSLSAEADLDGNGVASYLELLVASAHKSQYGDEFLAGLRMELGQNRPEASSQRPNIVMIVADDLGYGDVSSFWPPGGISTPSIDGIAAAGAALTNFHVYPVCAPSRSVLFSGRFVRDMRLAGAGGPAEAGIPRGAQTIPEFLQLLGYSTAAVGKWHLSSRPGFRPYEQGFQEWMGFYGGVSYYDIESMRDVAGATYFEEDKPFLPRAEHSTDAFADRAIDYIRRDHTSPFFLYIAFNAPHTPHWCRENPVFSAPERWLEVARADNTKDSNTRLDYVALVRHMDARIGDILNALDAQGLRNDTLVIFTSDNGADTSISTSVDRPVGSNAYLRGGKGSVYEGGIRVPFVAQWPGVIPAGHEIDTFTMLPDLWPTLREAAGFPVRDNEIRAPRRGTSLVPLLTGRITELPSEIDRTAHFGFSFKSHGVIRYPWKLVREDGAFLFNIAEDPSESTPLNDIEVERFEELLDALMEHLR